MDEVTPTGEFHHFQLVSANGDIPFSISVLVHYNQKGVLPSVDSTDPIPAEEVIQLHEALKNFDGDFINAFSPK